MRRAADRRCLDPLQRRLLPLRIGLRRLRRRCTFPLSGCTRVRPGLRLARPRRGRDVRRHPFVSNHIRLEKRSFRMDAPQTDCSQLVKFAMLDDVLALSRANSLWPLTFGIACCAIEMMATGMARFDISRFGAEVFRPSPRQADLMIVAGTVNKKLSPVIKTLYDQMLEPKWVIAMGNCAISGGPFVYPGQYAVVEGVDKLFPVDVSVPGCPPRPEALLEGIIELEKKLTG